MSTENAFLELMSQMMRKTRSQLTNKIHRYELMKALQESKWHWNRTELVWTQKSQRDNLIASIFYRDLEHDPDLCAGFAKFHDPTFQDFSWAKTSPGWSERPPSYVSLLDEKTEKIVDDFIKENPWVNELDDK